MKTAGMKCGETAPENAMVVLMERFMTYRKLRKLELAGSYSVLFEELQKQTLRQGFV